MPLPRWWGVNTLIWYTKVSLLTVFF
jgi:hypothetical protein